jgi:predicted DNA binding CopG/RHH family protein
MKKFKLSKYEQSIEDEIDTYVPVPRHEFEAMKKMFEARKKNAVLNIRINQGDLDNLKDKAKSLGIKYQTFIAEVLHKVAMS